MGKQIIFGLAIVLLWSSLMYFSSSLASMFGNIAWLEKNLWGTRNGLVIFGFGITIIWLLILFGVIPVSTPADQLPAFPTT